VLERRKPPAVTALSRKRQASIRLSLGAARWRLIRQALIETLAIFSVGAVAGATCGLWLTRLLTDLIPFENADICRTTARSPLTGASSHSRSRYLRDGTRIRVAPAWETARADVSAALKDAGSTLSGGSRRGRLRLVLVAAQIVIAACCFRPLRPGPGFRTVWTEPMGFESAGLLSFRMTLDDRHYTDATQRRIFFESAGRRWLGFHGQASCRRPLRPIRPRWRQTTFHVEGQEPADPRGFPSRATTQ